MLAQDKPAGAPSRRNPVDSCQNRASSLRCRAVGGMHPAHMRAGCAVHGEPPCTGSASENGSGPDVSSGPQEETLRDTQASFSALRLQAFRDGQNEVAARLL